MVSNPQYTLEDITRTLRKHEKRLLTYPNVIYLGIGEKIRSNEGSARLAIRVYVVKKVELWSRGTVPKRLRAIKEDGTLASYYIPTDIEEKPLALETLGIKGGDAIAGATLGSIGFVFQGNDGHPYILTNAHVALGINELANNQPLFDLNLLHIGNVFRATQLLLNSGHVHYADAAVAIPTVQTDSFIIDSNPSSIVAYGIKMDLFSGFGKTFFYQRRSGARLVFKAQNWIATPRIVNLGGHSLLFTNFFELTMVQGSSRPQAGDSGSVIVSDSGNGLIVHGLLFAGSGETIGVFDISDVFNALNSI